MRRSRSGSSAFDGSVQTAPQIPHMRKAETEVPFLGAPESELSEFFRRKPGLLQDASKGAGSNFTRMNGHIGLSAIGVSENFVAARLPYLHKTRAQQFPHDLTGFVRHRRPRSEPRGCVFLVESLRCGPASRPP